jgi:hypothetical protein
VAGCIRSAKNTGSKSVIFSAPRFHRHAKKTYRIASNQSNALDQALPLYSVGNMAVDLRRNPGYVTWGAHDKKRYFKA